MSVYSAKTRGRRDVSYRSRAGGHIFRRHPIQTRMTCLGAIRPQRKRPMHTRNNPIPSSMHVRKHLIFAQNQLIIVFRKWNAKNHIHHSSKLNRKRYSFKRRIWQLNEPLTSNEAKLQRHSRHIASVSRRFVLRSRSRTLSSSGILNALNPGLSNGTPPWVTWSSSWYLSQVKVRSVTWRHITWTHSITSDRGFDATRPRLDRKRFT